jgi:protein TonB
MAERASSEPIVDPGIQRDYEARLLAWLAGHKRYPGSARRSGHEGTIMLRFVIDADGRLRSYELLERSVYAGLNSAVERMVESAAPMPPVPAELRRGRAEFSFTVPVEFVIHP